MKTEEYIKEHWLPIVKPGAFIKQVDEKGCSTFILVTKKAKFRQLYGLLNGIELEGIWILRPTHIYNDRILTSDKLNNCAIIITENYEISLTTYKEMLDAYTKESEEEISELKQKVKTIKDNIRNFKRNFHHLKSDLEKIYNEALDLSKTLK